MIQNKATNKFYQIAVILVIFILSVNGWYYLNQSAKLEATFTQQKQVLKQLTDFTQFQSSILIALFEPHRTPTDIQKEFAQIELNQREIMKIPEVSVADSNLALSTALLKSNFNDYYSLSVLVIDKNKEAYANPQIFGNELTEVGEAYKKQLIQLQLSLSDYLLRNSMKVDFIRIISLLLFIGILSATFYVYIWPIILFNEKMKMEVDDLQSQMDNKDQISSQAIESEAETIQALKIKTAQIAKMQSTVEESLNQSSQAKENIRLINYQFASGLSKALSPILLQKEILDNRDGYAKDENWVTLSNAISKLQALTGYYYSEAMEANREIKRKEVYLNQLFGEVLSSIDQSKSEGPIVLGDLPKIKTDEHLLKLTIQPFFELVHSLNDPNEKTVSATLRDSGVEIVVHGISQGFVKYLKNLEQTEKANFSLDQFKVFMSMVIIKKRKSTYSIVQNGETRSLVLNWMY